MRIGPVRVMGPGVVLVLCVKEVSDFSCVCDRSYIVLALHNVFCINHSLIHTLI